MILTTGPLHGQQTAPRPAETAFLESRIARDKPCTTCHTIGASGGTVGPNLNQVGNRRDAAWLKKWLSDPNAVKEGTKMPNFGFTDAELDELVGYLSNLSRPVPSQEILASTASLPVKGKRLFEAYDCRACHRLGNTGGFSGPDLTWAGHRKSTDWEKVWLKDPSAYKPGTFMPNFQLSDAEIEALATYVHSQNGQENDAGRSYERLVLHPYFSPGTPADYGAFVFQRFGCRSCHGDEGRGHIPTSNAASGPEVPRLVGVTNQKSDDAIRTIVLQGITVQRANAAGPEPYQCPSWEGKMTDEEVTNLIAYLKRISPRKIRFRLVR